MSRQYWIAVAALLLCACTIDADRIAVDKRGRPIYAPNEFYISFKPVPDAREAVARSPIKDRIVLPEVLPDTPDNAQLLATALSASVEGWVEAVYFNQKDSRPTTFAIKATAEQAEKLVEDPRVDSVGRTPMIYVDSG